MHSWAATPSQEKMLEQIHFHLTGNEDLETCTKECCISHRKFELSIVEIVSCAYACVHASITEIVILIHIYHTQKGKYLHVGVCVSIHHLPSVRLYAMNAGPSQSHCPSYSSSTTSLPVLSCKCSC